MIVSGAAPPAFFARPSRRLRPAAGQFVEELFVQSLTRVLRPRRQENVPSDELVDHFAIRRRTTEHDVALLELDHHVLHLPVHVPRLHRVVPPRLLVVAGRQVHLHDAVVRHPQQLLLLVPHELDHEQRYPEVGQRLPRFDVVHLGLDQRQVLDVRVGLQDPGMLRRASTAYPTALLTHLSAQLFHESRGDVILHLDVEGVGVDGGAVRRPLHLEEVQDGLLFRLVTAVGEGPALRRQPAARHPFRVLRFLKRQQIFTKFPKQTFFRNPTSKPLHSLFSKTKMAFPLKRN
jgi:hypothetical protein